tara:strand:- start:830 stop:994 length:165 start_codon:yes stop_codon:yes gene_type:complete
LTELIKIHLAVNHPSIAKIAIVHGPNRKEDILHSLASIGIAEELLSYNAINEGM